MKQKQQPEKNNYYLLVIAGLLILGFYLYGKWADHSATEQLSKDGKTTTGRIVELRYMKGPDVVIEYIADGKTIQKRVGSPCEIFIGDEFPVRYSAADPAVSDILFEEPVIPGDYLETSGKITRIDDDRFKRCQFKYSLNGTEYAKQQVVASTRDITMNQTVFVRFDPADPKKSFIRWA